MSYYIRIKGRIEGTEEFYVTVLEPEYNTPTYNLRHVFVNCMDWVYETGVKYPCDEVIIFLERGIERLKKSPEKYKGVEAENGWGTVEDALKGMQAWRKCILELAQEIPLKNLYFQW